MAYAAAQEHQGVDLDARRWLKSHEPENCEVPSYPHCDNVCAIFRQDRIDGLGRWADDVTLITLPTFQVIGQSRDDVPKVD